MSVLTGLVRFFVVAQGLEGASKNCEVPKKVGSDANPNGSKRPAATTRRTPLSIRTKSSVRPSRRRSTGASTIAPAPSSMCCRGRANLRPLWTSAIVGTADDPTKPAGGRAGRESASRRCPQSSAGVRSPSGSASAMGSDVPVRVALAPRLRCSSLRRALMPPTRSLVLAAAVLTASCKSGNKAVPSGAPSASASSASASLPSRPAVIATDVTFVRCALGDVTAKPAMKTELNPVGATRSLYLGPDRSLYFVPDRYPPRPARADRRWLRIPDGGAPGASAGLGLRPGSPGSPTDAATGSV